MHKINLQKEVVPVPEKWQQQPYSSSLVIASSQYQTEDNQLLATNSFESSHQMGISLG